MKKSVFFLTLLLCLSLIFPGAHAEDTYVPGERMRSLVSSALEAGQLVGGEAHFSLTLPDSMLPDDEEGRAQFDALAEVIQGVSLAGGMGRLDDGYRVELGGAYTAPSGDNVYVTGAANLTADGLSLESNLIEGERLSIRWETLLEMLGLSENEIDALLSLPTTDWDSALNELNDELAQAAAKRDKVDMRMYRVIYDAINEITDAMKGMLAPKFREAIIGHAEVRQTYKVSAIGTIAGCYVKDGKITRDASVRVLRDNIVIHEGKLGSLQRFKDAVKEVAAGYECGMSIEKFNDIKEGDIFECFVMEQIKE